MRTITINKSNQTIKLNNKLYSKYIFKLNSLIYIQSTQINNYKNILDLLNSSKLNKYSLN